VLELHTHSTCSDGVLTPTQLVQKAAQAGVKALALTDHDTIAGLPEARAAAADVEMEIVPGVELSTTHQGFSLHILGFYPRLEDLAAALVERQRARVQRAGTMLTKLATLGMPLTLPEATSPGRVHIARAMVAAGYVKEEREAFDRFLGEGKPVCVPYEPLSAEEGVRLLRDCGAIPVWAHPLLFRGGPTDKVLALLVAAGLQGLEVYRPEISPTQRTRLDGLARYYRLAMTGGSDYHGTPSQGQEAIALNMLHLPLTLLERLKARRA
jgi:3',5'-nucleoside bisphosphate phosphatase